MRRTRKQKIAELQRLLKEGPSLAPHDTSEDAMRVTKLWLRTWVEPLVDDLVPELRKQQDKYAFKRVLP